jgi:hypothetical protein
MSAGLAVRQWVPSDFTQVLALGQRLHELSRFSFLPFEPARVRRLFDLHIAQPRKRCGFIAHRGSVSVGILAGRVETYTFCDELVASDEIFFVDPARCGGWAAVRLFKAFRSWAVEVGARELHLATATGIEPERTGRFFGHFDLRPIGALYAMRLH